MRPALVRLFPDERGFFARFTDVARRVGSAAALLEQSLEFPDRAPGLLAEILRINRDAKHAATDIEAAAIRMFIPPLDREDIHALATRVTWVADTIGGTARRANSLRLGERHEAAVALSRLVVQATHEITEALSLVRDAEAVLRCCRAIKHAEEEGDAAWERAVAQLFEGAPDPLDVLRWKTVYDQLEEALDACDAVANALETLTVKHG